VAAALSAGLLGVSHAGADTDRVDQRCDVGTRIFYAYYTMTQSFTPAVSSITRWDAQVGIVDTFSGTLTSRIVVFPTGDVAQPLPGTLQDAAGPGIPIVEATAKVTGGRFSTQWVTFTPSSPVPVLPLPGKGAYGIEIDFPLDLSFAPYGGHIGWATCAGSYEGGRAWVTLNPDGLRRAGEPLPALPSPASGVPLVRLSDPRATEYAFRIYGK
jgi:hypothetical protein